MSQHDPHDAFDQLLADWLRIEPDGKPDAEQHAFAQAVLDQWQHAKAANPTDDEAMIDDLRRLLPVAGTLPHLRLTETESAAGSHAFDKPARSPSERLAAIGRTTWRRYATAACLALIGLLALVFMIAAMNQPKPTPTQLAAPFNHEPPVGSTTAEWSGVVAEVNWLNERPEAIRQGVRQLFAGVDVVEMVESLQPSIGAGVEHQGPVNWQELRSWLREQAD